MLLRSWRGFSGRVVLVLSFAIVAVSTFAKSDGWHTVAHDQMGDAARRSHLDPSASFYTFDEPAKSPLRFVAFGNSLSFGYGGLDPTARYRVRLVFVSDGVRSESVTVDGLPLIPKIDLDKGPAVVVEHDLPKLAAGTRLIRLGIHCLAGPNAVVSEVDILSTSPKQLTPIKFSVPSTFLPTVSRGDLENALPVLTQRPDGGVMNLSGVWQFSPTATPGFEKALKHIDWHRVAVPGEWVMQGFNVTPNSPAAYFRSFELAAKQPGRRYKLRFSAVYSLCKVFVNGVPVGGHEGGFVPFECDLTDAIKPGHNTLALSVQSESMMDKLSSGSQYAAHPLGGITRKVQLFSVPELHLSDLKIATRFDGRFRNAVLSARCVVSNESGQPVTGTTVTASVLGIRRSIQLPKVHARERVTIELRIPVTHPPKWDCEHPNLCRLTVQIRKGSRTTESVSESIGFRQIEVKVNQVFVNGQAIKLHGVCRHEAHPLLGRALNDELWKTDARLLREMNCNFVRTSHYPPAEEFLAECDRRGIFVELEAPLCWVGHDASEQYRRAPNDKSVFDHILRAELDTVQGYPNHPSVIMRSLANESAWTPLFARAAAYVRLADPTRPTTFQDQCWGSYNNYGSSSMPIGIYHYPDLNGPAAADREPRPIQFGEYCHLNTYNRREILTDPGVRDYYGFAIKPMWDLIYRSKGSLGGSIWSGIDDVFLLPDGRGVGYGEWGPIDGWRRLKPEAWNIKKAYSPVRVLAAKVVSGKTMVQIENRHLFTNLSEMRVEWAMTSLDTDFRRAKLARVAIDVPPRCTGAFTLPSEGSRYLYLRFTATDGTMVDEELMTMGHPTPIADAARSVARSAGLLTNEKDGRLLIDGGGFGWQVDLQTGRIVRGDVQGKTVLSSGPMFMMLPLTSDPCAPDYGHDLPPLNNACSHWRTESVTKRVDTTSVSVAVKGEYDEAHGSYTMTFGSDGSLKLDYAFSSNIEMNPRQWGMVFTAPASQSRITWNRDTLWSTYPEEHIGRPTGTASATLNNRGTFLVRKKPNWRWEQDETNLGSDDFRSTRAHIRWLRSDNPTDGRGFRIESEGHQATRAWRDGNDAIALLVAGFNTGGGEGFARVHYASEFRPIHKGGMIRDSMMLRLVR